MILANRALLYSAKQLKTHRQQHPARFERILEESGVYCRYYSEEPAILFGEYVLSQLKAQGDPTGRFVFVQKLDESLWFFASFEDGQLERESIGLLDAQIHSFDYSLRKAERIIATDKAFNGMFMDERLLLIEPFALDEMAAFTLQAKKTLTVNKWGGVMLAAVLFSIVATVALYPEPEPVVNVVDDAKTRYSKTHLSYAKPMDALMSGLNLLMDASFMPAGIEAKKVILTNQTLSMTVNEEDIAPSIKSAWLVSMPSLTQHYQDNSVTLSLVEPNPWRSYAVKGYSEQLQDVLFYQGGTLTQTAEQYIDDTRIRTYQLNFTGNAGQIPLLAQWLNVPFVTVSFMEMEMDDAYQITTLNMTLDVQGEPL
ncbi:hypothetical protein DZ860_21100 [Vibrio sinensis]|uniref:Uncharacterized protein n=1 Tax=Vibrio sinensis TaxID=2302434 RepID=A0A3A6QDI4_9VIBR|nr:hypothetical protein [Vibrio sinensis]RJX65859.1 hypothetical protein DZ860_21100 [Vibrio sinensis]